MILDTCALLWLAEGGRHLSQAARDRIEEAPVVYVSSISAFEIGINADQASCAANAGGEWFGAVVDHHNLAVQSLDWKICITATELPPIHKDPCDRFIIAAAKMRHMPVVTADDSFAAYGIEIIA